MAIVSENYDGSGCQRDESSYPYSGTILSHQGIILLTCANTPSGTILQSSSVNGILYGIVWDSCSTRTI